MKRKDSGAYIYHLCYDDTVDNIVVAHAESLTPTTVERAWYEEWCLDPAPELNVVGLVDFEAILI